MKRSMYAVSGTIMLLSLLCGGVWAQEEKPAGKAKPAAKAPAPPKNEVAELLKGATRMDGFLTLHRKDEVLYAEIPKSGLDKPFLMNHSVARGVAQGYVVSGLMRDEAIYYWKLADKRLFLVKKNVRHLSKSSGPISKAVAEDFSDSIVAVLQVRAKSNSVVIVDLADFLFTDYAQIAQDLKRTLGLDYSLDAKRTIWGSVKVFPENVEIEVAATYSGRTLRDVRTVADSRAVSVTSHFSFSSIPKSDYKPRPADDRIGYFLTVRKDYSLKGHEAPFTRYVNRWKLEKADSSAELSPPKKPIVFYIEKSVPYEFRPIVREGILEWNKAFEKAGFINAIEVRFQEEDAAWDAEDVRYNTIRWMTGEARYAIGPSRANPLTGEIYDADILVDSNWLRTFERQREYYTGEAAGPGERSGAAPGSLEAYILELEGGEGAPFQPDEEYNIYRCAYTAGLGEQMVLASVAAELQDAPAGKKGVPKEFIRQGLKELIMHEVGHTLGLRHNFKASSVVAFEDLHNKKLTAKEGLVGSVMDYSLVNLAPKGEKQGHYFTPTLGPWDYLAIEYGYKELDAKGAGEQAKALNKIAARSAKPKLAYGTDEDLGADIDPYVNQRDMGDDPLAFSKQRTEIMRGFWGSLIEKLTKPGEGYQKSRTAFLYTLRDIQRAQYFAARYVGGFSVNRNHRGDAGERPALEIVPAAKQREALEFIGETALSGGAYSFDPEMLSRLTPDRWNHWGSGMTSQIDLGLHNRVLAGQLRIVYRLFSSKVLARVEESALYVEEGEELLTIADVYGTVTEAIWSELGNAIDGEAWSASRPFISGYRRNLQRAYLKYTLLSHVLNPPSSLPQDARSVAWMTLRTLSEDLDALLEKVENDPSVELDALSNAHLLETQTRIEKALDAAFSVQNY